MLRGPTQASSNADRQLLPFCFFLIILLFLPLAVSGQSGTDSTGTGGKHVIRGRIYFPSGVRVDSRIQVRLEGYNTGGLSVMCDGNGSFQFSSLAPGSYTVVVDGGENYENVRESVYIDQDIQGPPGVRVPTFTRPYTVNIELQPKRSVVQPNRNGVVDASLAAIPEPARGLYQQGQESAQANKHDAAVEKFLAAIAQFPQFPQAFNELGVQYLFLNQADKAVQALRSAVRLAEDAYSPRLNLGMALFLSNKADEADTELRTAQKKNESDWQSHYWLGKVSIRLKRLTDAEKEFRRALELGGNDLPLPHYYLGGIYWQTGDRKRAADELEQYLKLYPQAQDAERIRQSIRELRGKSS
jgi:Flp pilus assembly protein TadD